jgi:tRNA dimethylallyltransferase
LRGKIPFIVGGTGFYISALIKGLAEIPPISPATKEYVRELMAKQSAAETYSYLSGIDPLAAAGMEQNDLHRQQRALEVFCETGKPISSWWQTGRDGFSSKYLNILFTRKRAHLYERINKRIDQMLAQGLTGEIKKLLELGFKESDPGMNSVGYREFFPWLRNEITLSEAVEKAKQHSRNYAKRQITWYNRQDFHLTIDLELVTLFNIRAEIEVFLEKVKKI